MTEAASPKFHADEVSLAVEGLNIRYRVYDDQARSLRRFVARGFRPTEHREVHAVRGIDLVVTRGEALGVIGRNGSGKSTLLRAMAGLIPPSEGSVCARSNPVLLGVGSVLQPELSCRRNIEVGGTALGLARAEARSRRKEVLEFAGIQEFADLPFRALSSGMRARLQFAIATLVRPRILMIDETLAVGDAEFRSRSEEKMKEMIGGDATVVLVSHSMGLISSTCTSLVWIDQGRIAAAGPVDEVIGAYQSSQQR